MDEYIGDGAALWNILLNYISNLDIDQEQITDIIVRLDDNSEHQGIVLLNSNKSEIHNWKQLLMDVKHVVQHQEHVAEDVTQESLYPERIDEEKNLGSRLSYSTQIDVISVKLPCNKLGRWSRDMARLHLQLQILLLLLKFLILCMCFW